MKDKKRSVSNLLLRKSSGNFDLLAEQDKLKADIEKQAERTKQDSIGTTPAPKLGATPELGYRAGAQHAHGFDESAKEQISSKTDASPKKGGNPDKDVTAKRGSSLELDATPKKGVPTSLGAPTVWAPAPYSVDSPIVEPAPYLGATETGTPPKKGVSSVLGGSSILGLPPDSGATETGASPGKGASPELKGSPEIGAAPKLGPTPELDLRPKAGRTPETGPRFSERDHAFDLPAQHAPETGVTADSMLVKVLEILRCGDLSSRETQIYASLLLRSLETEEKQFQMSYAEIEQATGIRTNKIPAALTVLVNLDLIKRHTGHGTTNIYSIVETDTAQMASRSHLHRE